MSDLTPSFNELLTSHDTHTSKDVSYSLEQLNEFLKQAYRITQQTANLLSHLRSIRRPYLSTAPAPRRRLQNQVYNNAQSDHTHLSDNERDIIDAQSKALLRDLHAAVTQLRSAESIRIQTETAIMSKRKWRNGGGVLSRWAAGAGVMNEKSEDELQEEGARDTIKRHRDSVIWFLERGLEEAGKYQGDMMTIRVQREVEKGKSVLYKTSGRAQAGSSAAFDEDILASKMNGPAVASGVPMEELEGNKANGGADTNLDAEQLQSLEKENQDLVKHYENKLDQMRGVEKSLMEISELQTTLAMNMATQSAQIDQLVQDSLSTTENVTTGNKELKKASERRSTAKTVFWATCIGCSVAIVWDAII